MSCRRRVRPDRGWRSVSGRRILTGERQITRPREREGRTRSGQSSHQGHQARSGSGGARSPASLAQPLERYLSLVDAGLVLEGEGLQGPAFGPPGLGAKATSTPSAASLPFPAPPFPGHHAPSPAPRSPAGAAGSAPRCRRARGSRAAGAGPGPRRCNACASGRGRRAPSTGPGRGAGDRRGDGRGGRRRAGQASARARASRRSVLTLRERVAYMGAKFRVDHDDLMAEGLETAGRPFALSRGLDEDPRPGSGAEHGDEALSLGADALLDDLPPSARM